MHGQLRLGEARIARLVDDGRGQAKGRERRHRLKQSQIEAFAGRSPPARVVALLHAGHLFRPLGRDEAVKTVRSGQRPARAATTGEIFHPRRWPGTLGRENPLHINAKLDGSPGQEKRQQVISYGGATRSFVRATGAISTPVSRPRTTPWSRSKARAGARSIIRQMTRAKAEPEASERCARSVQRRPLPCRASLRGNSTALAGPFHGDFSPN